LKTWSAITLVISQNGLVLSSGAAAVLIIIFLYAVYLDMNEKRSLLTLYRKLPSQDQLLIQAINNAGKSASTKDITIEFQKLSTLPITEQHVTQKLKEAETHGLITQIINNSQDTPVLTWKIQL
ncbi:MAG: hypothetical protein LBE70_00560, partial [Nitrososphaerota archaeon]|nr:hypothetical protein [Nitrososphaerota archaeon]